MIDKHMEEDIRLEEIKKYHPSLQQSLLAKPVEPPKFVQTEGLVGRDALQLYQRKRAIHDTTIPRAQRPATAIGLVSHASSQKKPSSAGVQKICCFIGCRLMNNESHVSKFMHKCARGKLCNRILDSEHCKFFVHLDDHESSSSADMDLCTPSQPTWWDARYQNFQTRPSTVPRGGIREAGGAAPEVDNVALEITGIDRFWNDEEFADCIVHLAGPQSHLIRHLTYVLKAGNEVLNSGSGVAVFRNYSDAEKIVNCLAANDYKELRMRAVYTTSLLKETDRIVESTQDTTSFNRPRTDPAVLRYSKRIRDCGPYCEDARALLDRMIRDGHKPVLQNYIELIRSYRDAKPPQPFKAEEVLREMYARGIKHTTACNLVVDTLCRCGYMKRAEELVTTMEKGEKEELTAPNEDTYRILVDGWARTGTYASIQTEGLYQVPPDKQRPAGSMGAGLVGADRPATSALTTWARRRSGYMPLSCGVMAEKRPQRPKGWLEEEDEGDIAKLLQKRLTQNLVRLRPWRAVH